MDIQTIVTNNTHIYNFVMERRKILLPTIFQRCNSKVIDGPFKNMTILPQYCWGDGDTAGKLLGLYEDELYPTIEQEIENDHDLIINYGCAEGFYGVGMAIRCPTSRIVLFDIAQKALDVSKQNAIANSVSNINYTLECNHLRLNKELASAKNPLIIMDCEGAEDLVLDLEKVPELARTTVLVETHDCILPGITDRLILKFNDSHDLFGIIQGSKNLYRDPIHDFSDTDKWILNNENRPSTMSWIHMTPRTNNESV